MKEESFTGASKDMMIVRYKAVDERGARVDQRRIQRLPAPDRPSTTQLIHRSFAKPFRESRPAAHSAFKTHRWCVKPIEQYDSKNTVLLTRGICYIYRYRFAELGTMSGMV